MPATRPTTMPQRQALMHLAHSGLSYAAMAEQFGLSRWTARKWARRARAGELAALVTHWGRPPTGPLAGYAPLVRYLALRLKRQHPGWGAGYIRLKLTQHPALRTQALPAAVSIWRYWRSFGERLLPARHAPEPKPPAAGVVHGVWQLDFKESVDVPGVGPVTLAQARDSCGRATVLHRVHPAEQPGQRIVKLTTEQVQADCRLAFSQWGLPDAIQTDRASLFRDDDPTPFPTRLSLWWLGLSITHQFIPRHTPECNGSVERSHGTLTRRTLSGPPFAGAEHLQAQVDADWTELNSVCPSRARGCDGQPPLRAFPDLARPRRLYFPEQELAQFDLASVHTYLAHFTWVRLVNSHGQLSLGGQRYGVGKAWAGQQVAIRFEPRQQVFTFSILSLDPEAAPLRRDPLTRPARGLSVTEICGPIAHLTLAPRQLNCPWAVFWPSTPPQARLSERPGEARD